MATTLEFTVGRLLCRPVREYLERRKFMGWDIDWLEGRGLVQRDWIVRGPCAAVDAVRRDLEHYFSELDRPAAGKSGD